MVRAQGIVRVTAYKNLDRWSIAHVSRHAICYVLNNWRRHEEDRAKVTKTWKLDPFERDRLSGMERAR
jgi:hypothetical protein